MTDRGPSTPIRTLFVANRGEIATRIARTCERLGIVAITPLVGPAGGSESLDLLDPGVVVTAAVAAGADAVHPGYGFLSESPAFAEAVTGAGMRWVGPPADAIRAMGDKAGARRLARSLGIPVLPGYDDADQSDDALASAASRIGCPVLVKPSAGGGGKGMRVVRSAAQLSDALAAARREARGAFADERLILERFLEGPRHVEIQVLFDRHGAGIHLGERDCSLQRRHQKVLEESPSPAVTPQLRARLADAALRLASAVGYVNAGTVEFLLADDGAFYFLEMNTRLQVEHPVTEAVTGRDLVADQLRIVEGVRLAELGLEQALVETTLAAGGHAVEVRVYAEDPSSDFLPATGTVFAATWPSDMPGVRVDSGVAVGDAVGVSFDPLLAKVIAHGRDRTEAFERLAAALARTEVLGLVTNVAFLRWLVDRPTVRFGEARIDTLATEWDAAAREALARIPDDAWDEAAERILSAAGSGNPGSGNPWAGDPWAGGWRVNAGRTIRLAVEDRERTVVRPPAVPRSDPRGAPARPAVVGGDAVHLSIDGRSVAFRLAPPPDVERAARAAAAHHAGGASPVESPMPGRVIAVHVAPGARVEPGDPLVTIEAMKMEHVVPAPSAGRVADLGVAVGDQVGRGQALAVLEP